MCLARRPEALLDAEMDAGLLKLEPAAASLLEMRRLGDSWDVEDALVEGDGFRLSALRRGELHVLNSVDAHCRVVAPSSRLHRPMWSAPSIRTELSSGPCASGRGTTRGNPPGDASDHRRHLMVARFTSVTQDYSEGDLVREGHDTMAGDYLAWRDAWKSDRHLRRLDDLLARQSRILDVDAAPANRSTRIR